MSQSNIKFVKNSECDFYQVLKERVNDYFKENNISKHANWKMIAKTIFILTGTITSYLIIIFQLVPDPYLLIFAALLGLFTALIGLNIAHDALHGAYFSNSRYNKLLGVLFNIAGANDYIWKIKHNVIHHTYTNVPDHDDDINQAKILRMEPTQKLKKIHRWQHIYLFILYPLSSLSWVFVKDYQKFFASKIQSKIIKHPKKELYRLIIFKMVYYAIYIVIPILMLDVAWYYFLLGFIIMHLVEGAALSFIFQLAHVFEGTSYPIAPEGGKMERSWAVHQLFTTSDFGRNSWWVNFFFGGLNFQVEHHLFPNICHIHYKNISPIVEKTAKEFDLPFLANDTFFGALVSHVNMMKQMGRPEPKMA